MTAGNTWLVHHRFSGPSLRESLVNAWLISFYPLPASDSSLLEIGIAGGWEVVISYLWPVFMISFPWPKKLFLKRLQVTSQRSEAKALARVRSIQSQQAKGL